MLLWDALLIKMVDVLLVTLRLDLCSITTDVKFRDVCTSPRMDVLTVPMD